jgi:cell division protein ZapA (FtsZ GTPase activity inhibitor)
VYLYKKVYKNFTGVTDLEILAVLVTILLRQDLGRLVNRIKPVEPWDKG